MVDQISKFTNLRSTEFTRLEKKVYLDHAGSALYTSSHLERHFEALKKNLFGDPHSGNSCGERTNNIVHQVRLEILQFFNVTLEDYNVVFTSSATEALKMIGRYFDWKDGSTFAYLEDNHTSVVGIRNLAAEKGASCYCLCLDKSKKNSSTGDLNSYFPKLVKRSLNNRKTELSNDAPCIFAYPAQSNFSGTKYPLDWICEFQEVDRQCTLLSRMEGSKTQIRKWYVLCDAAAYAATSFLDLNTYHADFVTVSFYKIFGYPTGLGALLVRRESENVLCNKLYIGERDMPKWLESRDFHSPEPNFHDRMENGSVSFLSILALKNGFDTFKHLRLDIQSIHSYTHMLWRMLYIKLKDLRHSNGTPIVEVYLTSASTDASRQGPTLAFNVKRYDGSYTGYNDVLKLADNNNIYLRGGCFDDIGGCLSLVSASNDLLLNEFKNSHAYDDGVDNVDGKPIGALRASLGISSTKNDIETFVRFISSCFQKTDIPVPQPHFYNGIILEKIYIYPVKAAQPIVVDNWEISETGLQYDRMWMVMAENHFVRSEPRCTLINLTKCPQLVKVFPKVDLLRPVLIMQAAGEHDIEIPVIYESNARPDQKKCTVKVQGDKVDVFNCGEEASKWLCKVLETTCFLVQINLKAQQKRMNGEGCELSLVNKEQYHLLNRSSVKTLYQNLIVSGDISSDVEEESILMRFRGNFVVSGAPAFAENDWEKIIIYDDANEDESLEFTKSDLCSRCSAICVDPFSGNKTNGSLLQSLNDLSLPKQTFGVYFNAKPVRSTIRSQSKVLILK